MKSNNLTGMRAVLIPVVLFLVALCCGGCLMEELLCIAPRDPASRNTEPATQATEAPDTIPIAIPTDETGQLSVLHRGTVIAEIADVLALAEDGAPSVCTLDFGTRIDVYQITDNWVRIGQGWVVLDSVYIDGNEGEFYAGMCTVVNDDAVAREEPSEEGKVLFDLSAGDQLILLNTVVFGDTSWSCTNNGWMRTEYLYVDGTMDTDYGTITITGDILNVRSGPGTGYDVTTAFKRGDKTHVYKIVTVNGTKWGCTDVGWVCMDYVSYTAN